MKETYHVMECYIVKTKIYLFLTGLIISTMPLSAQVDTSSIGSEAIVPQAVDEDEPAGPYKISADFDYINKAKVKRKGCPSMGDLTFAFGMVDANFVYYYDKCIEEGAAFAVAYERTYLNWDENPYFTQKNIDTAALIFSGFSKRLTDWDWRAQVSVNFDNLSHWNYQDYMNYDLLLWGRYSYCRDVGLHIGFFAMTGMKFDRVYPIIGFDWQYSCNLKFNLVFPMNISAVYSINDHWSVALAGRFFNQRHRVRKDEVLSEAFYFYQSGGAELGLNYNPNKYFSANIHAGYDLGGHLTIRDRHYHNPRRFRIDAAPYAGAEAAVNF